ncbi:PepSY domain-containing protein [Lysinibacillus antri]|uniref:PepSY domain-containing protein n=1 Tax=Lysinibacillus antri TaxID=2498145 RepID=A0A432L925_9BACI|nr:PepSY domain-containing protein [Lysinibacillus antri]RUL49296.1 hypothetical protein EK386_15400 [Lysinibacillus antri]
MTNYTKWMIGLVVLMLLITAAVIYTIQSQFFKPEQLTIHEVATKIETLYGGTVESFEQKEDFFHMILERGNASYDLQIDATTGSVMKMNEVAAETIEDTPSIKTKEEIRTLLNSQNKGTIHSIAFQQGEAPQYIVEITENELLKSVTVNAKTGEILSEKVKQQAPESNNTPTITKDKAKQIALSQLNGAIQYVAYETSSDGGYYLVEIRTLNKAVTFQIHAISGNILSVKNRSLDDDEDDDDEED